MHPQQAIDVYVDRPFAKPAGKNHLSLVPTHSMDNFYLGLAHFDYSASAKNGCGGVENV